MLWYLLVGVSLALWVHLSHQPVGINAPSFVLIALAWPLILIMVLIHRARR